MSEPGRPIEPGTAAAAATRPPVSAGGRFLDAMLARSAGARRRRWGRGCWRGPAPRDDDPCLWNLTHPEMVLAIHRRDVAAGAEAVLTNTFGANRFWLARVRPRSDARRGDQPAAPPAGCRGRRGRRRFVVGDLGPTAAGRRRGGRAGRHPGRGRGRRPPLRDPPARPGRGGSREVGRSLARPVPLLVSLSGMARSRPARRSRAWSGREPALGGNCQDGMAAALEWPSG